MKLIAKTENDGWLISASHDEVLNLVGYYSKYQDRAPTLKIGDQITINVMYEQLSSMSRNRKTLSKAAKELRALADLLIEKEPIIFGKDEP